jgi:hypothetical protein
MDRKEAVRFLRDRQGYSKRLSSKIVDLALLQKSKPDFAVLFEQALQKCEMKKKKKAKQKFIIKE